jgi:hypothetical protein
MFRWDAQVKNTFDHYHHVFLLRTYALVYAALVLPLSLILGFLDIRAGVFMAVVMLLFFAPFLTHHLLSLREIHRNPQSYRQCDAVMKENHSGFARTVYLVLEITLPNGTTLRTQSSSVFSPGVLDRHYYGNLFGKKLHVLYDEENERLLVQMPEENA